MAPVLTAAISLVPVAMVTAGSVAAAVVSSVVAPTRAQAASGSVLVLLTGGESSAPEAADVPSGYTVTQVTPSQWAGMSLSQFQSYSALVIGDPSTASSCSSALPTGLGSVWQQAVSGNVAALGTAPAQAGAGGKALISDALAYTVAGSSTGLYVSLNCDYSGASAGTAVGLLSGVEGIGAAAAPLTVQGGSCSDSGTVNTQEADATTFNGLANSSLTGWPAPICAVQETFVSWPASFTSVAYDTSASPADFTASDGVTGQPYVLLGAPVSAATKALAPSVNGEVPAGSTAGGGGNPAAPGISQPTAGDPVNTENGDFTQSNADLSIPAFGPSLSFTRSYDALQAQQQTEAGTPGPMGYGWTDNWASSLAKATPVAGDLYTIGGRASNTGEGGPPAKAAMNNPSDLYLSGPDLYIVDTIGNRIEEIPGSSKTQWGVTMTAGNIYTVAGSDVGTSGASGNGTAASSSLLDRPAGITMDASGNLYIADTGNARVVEIAASTGTQRGVSMTANDLYVIAGRTGQPALGNDGKPATSSDLHAPMGLSMGGSSHSEDLYIADSGNNRVQEVASANGTEWGQSMTANDVYTVAGSSAGTAGSSGDGGNAASALLGSPEGLNVTSGGNIYIADTTNCRIQMVPWSSGSHWGQTMTGGDIYTIAGRTGQCALGTDGKLATSSDLSGPVTVRDTGNGFYFTDTNNNRIQEVALSTHTEFGQSMTANDVYTIAGSASGTSGYSGNGGPSVSALLAHPGGVAVDSTGNVYLADTGNNEVREVSASTANISDAAGGVGMFFQDGDGGTAYQAGLSQPYGVASDGHGDTFVADAFSNRVQEIAAYSHTQFGISMTAGDVYTVAGQQGGYQGSSGDGGSATAARLAQPTSVAVDSSGNLYIADSANNRVQEVSASTGNISTFAGSAAGTAGDSGNGGPATSALLDFPYAVTVDSSGDVFIAGNLTNQVQEVPAASGNGMTAGDVYTIAGSTAGTAGHSGDGGPAASSLLDGPQGVAVDAAGDIYIADNLNNRIQEIAASTGTQRGIPMTKGDIYTIAGSATGARGGTGDGGPATAALLNVPGQIATDAAGDLFITDAGNNRIREIAVANGTQWGQSMTAGNIYDVAGSESGQGAGWGTPNGGGGPATSALLDAPVGIGTDAAGDLFLTNSMSDYLMEVQATSTSAFATYETAGALTITQPGGSQVTFYPQSGGSCASPYQAAGGYCVLPQDAGTTLTYNNSSNSYTYSPAPGGTTYTYASATGNLTGEADPAGNTLSIAYNTPAPGTGTCPATATSCETITSASGRALVLGSNNAGLVTSVTDPMGRQWVYAYNSASQLTSATDPMTNVTSYTYGPGSTGNPLLANDLLTITSPNAQPGGPDAGDATVNKYDSSGRVTSQTDPMGFTTTFNYCVNAATGDCMNPATGNGYVTVADPDGNTTVYDYRQGTLAAKSIWTGTTLTSETDNNPDLTAGGTSGGTLLNASTTDGAGNTTAYTYNPSGLATQATAPASTGQPATTSHAYTSLDQASCSGTAEASSNCSSSDTGPTPVAPGGVITPPPSAPPAGQTWTLYDTNGNELYSTIGVYQPGATSPSYEQTTYQLFKGNSITLNGTNINCNASPPSASLPCATINADGVVTQLGYNSAGDLTSSSTPDGNGSELATTTYGYDGNGEQNSTTSPDGNFAGANSGNYTTITNFNSDEQPTSVTEAGGAGATVTPRTTNYGYDANSNQSTVKDARGYTTTTNYNADNQKALVTDPDGNATLTCYDGAGNVAQTVPPTGVAAGSLTPASCPASYPAGYGNRLASDATTATFNALGQRTQQTTPAPAGQSGYETDSYTYDGDGHLLKTTTPATANGGQSQVTVDTYTAAGQLATETAGYGTPSASTISYCHDPNGDQTSVVYADGNTSGTASCETSSPWVVNASSYPAQAATQTTFSYDSAGEVVSTTTPATAAAPHGGTTAYTYDPAGNMLTRLDPNGVTTTWGYTPLNLTASVSYSGSSAHSVTESYDANDNKTGMTDATGTSSYKYNPFNEVTTATNAAQQATSYTYNPDGQVKTLTYPLPATATWATSSIVSFGYDHAGPLDSVTDFNGNQVSITPSTDLLPGSVALGATGDTITASYDGTDTPSAITLKNGGGTLQSFSYSDAPAGNILSETDTPSSPQSPASYTYDAQGRVTSMTPGRGAQSNYGFDASGNLTTTPSGATGNYDNAGELTSSVQGSTTTDYTYNADGERLTATQGSTTTASGTWNGAGELTAYSDAAANMTAAAYDGAGMRASSTTTPAGGSAVTQGYVWSTIPQVPQMIMDSGNAYIYGDGLAPIEQVNLSTGAITYLITDLLGSVRGTVNSSGALTGTTSYDAWGNPETTGGLTATTPFGFAGGYTDPTGLMYLLNRYYDPATGQFISVDPALTQTRQPYEYASGNPVSNTDPSGQFLNGYAYCSGGWWGYCDLVLDWYASITLIKVLERMDIWWDACREITEKVFSGNIADIFNILCNVFGGFTEYIAEYLKWRWDACGGEHNYYSGLYLHGDWWRYRYWWFGWHWSQRHYYWGWAGCWYW
jgi:RHS repeat-associated protein